MGNKNYSLLTVVEGGVKRTFASVNNPAVALARECKKGATLEGYVAIDRASYLEWKESQVPGSTGPQYAKGCVSTRKGGAK